MNIGATIKIIRKEKGFKQKEFAKILGMKYAQRLNFIENQNGGITKKLMSKILVALDIDLVVLHFRALEENDINPNKIEIFRSLQPLIIDLIKKT